MNSNWTAVSLDEKGEMPEEPEPPIEYQSVNFVHLVDRVDASTEDEGKQLQALQGSLFCIVNLSINPN